MVGPVGRIFRAPRDILGRRWVSVGAMTLVILVAIGFLSCWFLLYALTEWTQDLRRKPGTTGDTDMEINPREQWNHRVVEFRSKERP